MASNSSLSDVVPSDPTTGSKRPRSESASDEAEVAIAPPVAKKARVDGAPLTPKKEKDVKKETQPPKKKKKTVKELLKSITKKVPPRKMNREVTVGSLKPATTTSRVKSMKLAKLNAMFPAAQRHVIVIAGTEELTYALVIKGLAQEPDDSNDGDDAKEETFKPTTDGSSEAEDADFNRLVEETKKRNAERDAKLAADAQGGCRWWDA